MTIGEDRVRLDFNISGNEDVRAVKVMTSDLIDFCEGIKNESSDPEVKRLVALAQTEYENACMWAVKAITS